MGETVVLKCPEHIFFYVKKSLVAQCYQNLGLENSLYLLLLQEAQYTSGGTTFILLEAFTKHPSRSTADHISKSILRGRYGTVNGHRLLKPLGLESVWWGETRPRYNTAPIRILRGKGVHRQTPSCPKTQQAKPQSALSYYTLFPCSGNQAWQWGK